MAGESHTVKRSGRGEEIGRGGGPSRSQETGIDDRWQGRNTGFSDGDDEGRGQSVSRVELETFAVAGDEQTLSDQRNSYKT